jgi:hypothetical protein
MSPSIQRTFSQGSTLMTKTTSFPRVLSSVTIAVLVALLGAAAPCKAQPIPSPLGGVTLGGAFKVLGDKVNEAIERATGAGIILEVQAGGQIAVLIQQAQAAFQNQLDLQWRNLDSAQQKIIASVFSAANEFIDRTFTNLAQLESQAQAIINTLPFTKRFPQAWRFTPAFAVPNGTAPVRFEITGNFFDLPEKGFEAELVLNGDASKPPYPNVEKNSQRIVFEIPRAELKEAVSRLASNSVTVRIPYKKRRFLSQRKAYAEFRATIASLPQATVTITSTVTTTTPGPVLTQTNTSQLKLQASDRDNIECGGEHADLALHLAYPTNGWRVQPNTTHWALVWTQGQEGSDWFQPRNCSTPVTACLCVTTIKRGFGGESGKVKFHIVFTEEKDRSIDVPTVTTRPLEWGQTWNLHVPVGGRWEARYARFDGTTADIPAGGMKDSFLRVTIVGNTVTFATAPFESTFEANRMLEERNRATASR